MERILMVERVLMVEISHNWCYFHEIPATKDSIHFTITSNVPSEPKIKFGRYYKLWKVTADEWVQRCYQTLSEIETINQFKKMGISGERPFEKMLNDHWFGKPKKEE